MRLVADGERCCGAGMCALTAPEVFDQDDDGIVVLLVAELPDTQLALVQTAVRLCPSGALQLVPDGANGDNRHAAVGQVSTLGSRPVTP